jgi:hypothetical protein
VFQKLLKGGLAIATPIQEITCSTAVSSVKFGGDAMSFIEDSEQSASRFKGAGSGYAIDPSNSELRRERPFRYAAISRCVSCVNDPLTGKNTIFTVAREMLAREYWTRAEQRCNIAT